MGYKNLKHYRHTIHLYLDAIWKMSSNSKKARTSMYNWLSVQMDLPKEQTHATLFNRNQCRQAIKILRTKYIELYGKDLPYKKKERIKDMKINTKLLQEMVAKAIKGASDNKMIPITSLMGIELKNNKLTLMTTDGSNQLRVSNTVESATGSITAESDFYTVVDADTLAKLIAKTTSENITLTIMNNHLEVRGNGTYKLEIPMDEDGNVIKFPQFDINSELPVQQLSVELLKNILSTSKVSVAETMEVPCLTGYYLHDKVITTDRQMMCCINKQIIDNPILISSSMAELLQLLSGESVELTQDANKLLFKTANITIYGKQLEGLEMYPVNAIQGLINLTYNNIVKVNKQDFLNVLDRMNIFVSDYDKNGVSLSFTDEGLQITSQKSNASEIIAIDRDANKDFVPFNCLIDITMLQSQVQINSSDIIELHYGQEKSIKLVDGNTVMIICLLSPDE